MPRRVQGTTKFGWCMTNQHDECWHTNNNLTCSCKCHSEKKSKKKRAEKITVTLKPKS